MSEPVIDGGNASSTPTEFIDGGNASTTATEFIDGGNASSTDLPNPPTSVTATAASGGVVNVAWVPGASVDDPVTSWIVTGYQLGLGQISSASYPAAQTLLSVQGLPAAQSYWYEVVAVNAIGSSSTAQSNTVVVPAVIPPPAYTGWDQYQPFKYVCVNLVTGEVLAQSIPLTGVTFSKTLNGVGQFQGTIDLYDPNTQLVDALALTAPSLTAIMVDYNGSLVAGYAILSPRGYDWEPGKATLTVTGADPWTYFTQRDQATDYSSPPYSGITGPNTAMAIWNAAYTEVDGAETGWDPVLMTAQIISDALQTQPPYSNLLGGIAIAANGFPIQEANGNISTAAYLADAGSTPKADYVSQTFPFSSLQSIDTIASQICSLGYEIGPDKGFDVAYSNGPVSIPVGTINLSYPRRGRTYAENNLVLDARSVLSYQWPEDPSQMADTVYETGPSGAISALENIFPLQQGYPLLEKTVSRAQVTSGNITQQLFNLGLSDLFLMSYPVVVPQITISLDDPNIQLGQFIEGDDLLVRIPATDWSGENVWDPRFPSGLSLELRIQQYTVTVADDGLSTLQLTLNKPPGLVATGPLIPL